MSLTHTPKNSEIFIANSSVGSYLSFSIAMIVCLVTPSFSARSSCRSFLFFGALWYYSSSSSTMSVIRLVSYNLIPQKISIPNIPKIKTVDGNSPVMILSTMQYIIIAISKKPKAYLEAFRLIAISISSAFFIIFFISEPSWNVKISLHFYDIVSLR